ncbi:signal peptidase I [Paenibacillus sp. GCM10023248]|uniref:signal peptidase I n=1 Tax=Bacillales TaxID=1385 RepID=UPI002379FF40|nr:MULTISPECIES: signal peptidase I [Bacillales]MDD9270937.1 signal peptidase I [Paenibacillus sp. MAHUQ-63]MDR6882928.1 signal peptidase I [Bacillus sp. 3255]
MTEEVVEPRKQPVNKQKSEFWGWVRFILLLGLAYILINNMIGLTRVSGNSMNPTLQNGNILLMNKLSLFFSKPEYGDVVVIKDDRMGGISIIKRVIAVEGDSVFIRDGVIYVNQTPLPELYTAGKSEDMDVVNVPSGHLFVVGDNRNLGESKDSRDPALGPVHIRDVKGYALFSLFPMHKIAEPLDL